MAPSFTSISQFKPPLNGLKQNLRYQNQQPGNATTLNSNGRKAIVLEAQNEKQPDNDNVEKGVPVFAKPFKIPSQPDHLIAKSRAQNINDHSSSHNDGGKDVESILKMMTSTLEPLTKIAATPRTDIDVQTSNKPHVYANLPPMMRAPAINCNNGKQKYFFFKYIGFLRNVLFDLGFENQKILYVFL